MKLGPYDLQATTEDIDSAFKWWVNLSLNQEKELVSKYELPFQVSRGSRRLIHQIWDKEGKPEPQKLIPIPDKFKP